MDYNDVFAHLIVSLFYLIEVLMVNIGSLSTRGGVSAVRAGLAKIALTQPVCTEVGTR